MGNIPSESEVLDYFESLSNWGRWGKEDQLGTLNFITPEKTKKSLQLVNEGSTISMSRTITNAPSPDAPIPPLHFMIESGDGWSSEEKKTSRKTQGAQDFIGMAFHGYSITHVDSLSHFFHNGKMYNGWPANLVSTNLGATVESVEVASHGVITRGVLVDAPMILDVPWLDSGEGVLPEHIEEAKKQCDFELEEGDVMLVRTGHLKRRNEEGAVDVTKTGGPACHAACLPLIHKSGLAMLGSDTGNDVNPPPYPSVPQPIHQIGITSMGLWILDNADLEEISRACRARNQWTFLLIISPLLIGNATGSPVNPLAMF